MVLSCLMCLASVFVAYPRNAAKLPYVERTYMIGAVRKGETNVVVQGRNVQVYRTGAWATTVNLSAGSNRIEIVTSSGESTGVVYHVSAKKPPSSISTSNKAKRGKLPYAGDLPKDHPANRSPQSLTVVVDAGHGGSDTGALSPHGHCEKDANLKMALRVRDELAAYGYNVVMTRDSDCAIPLYDRPRVAHRVNADAFVSIHHNAPALHGDPFVRYHAVYAWNDIGKELSKAINVRMGVALGESLKNNGVCDAEFAVVRNPEIPSCLIEIDFLTSPAGEEACWSGSRRVLIAKAIAAGIADWCRCGRDVQPNGQAGKDEK